MSRPSSRTPQVAFVLTVLNEAASIGRLLDSLAKQTHQPDEIIICDAGSSDETIKKIQTWSRQHSMPIDVIMSPGANISRGRNLAIQAAHSQYIVVTDGGCILDAHWIERLVTALHLQPKLLAVYGGTQAIGRTWLGRLFADFYNVKTHSGHITNTEHSSRSVGFRKSAWEAVGGYPEWLTLAGEDTLFFQELEHAGATFTERSAFVYWHHGTDTLHGLYRVHRRNTIGSAEANLWPLRYQGLLALHAIGFTSLLLTPLLWVAAPAGIVWLLALWSRSSWTVYHHNHQPSTFIGLPAVFAARDLGSIVGYIIGLRRRLA